MINLKDLKRYILFNVKDYWSDLEKVRYVYVISGRYLQKHTEFFLTLDDKLTETALTPKKLDKVYMGRLNKDEWNKMLCKTGAEFIKDVLNELGIQSTLVETVDYTKIKGMKNHLHHYFLSVTIDDNKNIFLTPAADYSNIQNGFCTLRFGSEISYKLNGKPFYKSNNGEIPHITLTRKEVKELDDKLGFTTKIVKESKNGNNKVQTEYLDELIKKNKNAYTDFLAMDTDFYKIIMPENIEERKFKSVLDPTNNWNNLINFMCIYTGKRIEEITGNTYEYTSYINRGNFNKWVEYINTLFNKDDYDQKEVYYANPTLLVSKVKALCELIISFISKDKEDIDKNDVLKFRNNFNRLLLESSKHFIDKRFVIEPKDSDKYVSNTYINHKFSTFFPYVVNANNGKEPLNNEGFSEQIEYVKRIIELMFDELNKKNILIEDEDFKLNPIFKRINIYSMRKRNNTGYGIYVSILDSDYKNNKMHSTYWYKYDLTENKFEKTSLSKITLESSKFGKYEILSNRLKSVLENIENGTDEPPVCARGALTLK